MTTPLGVVLIIGFGLALILLIAARSGNRRPSRRGATGGSDAAFLYGDADCGPGDSGGDCGGDGGGGGGGGD
jgi:hypothetical protein